MQPNIKSRVVEAVRLQYALGDKSIGDLLDRWIPEVTATDIELILSYKVLPEVCEQYTSNINQMEDLRDDIMKALGAQSEIVKADVSIESVDQYTPEAYWKDTYDLLKAKYEWLDYMIFYRVRSNSIKEIL